MPDFLRCFIRSRQSHRRIKAVSKTNSCTSLEKSKSIRLIILVIEKSARGSRQTRSIFPEDSITSVKANERKKRRSRSAMGAQEDKKHARSEETSPETSPVTFLNPLSADRRIERSLKKKKIKKGKRKRKRRKKEKPDSSWTQRNKIYLEILVLVDRWFRGSLRAA